PVLNALTINAQTLFLTRGNRIEETDALDETAFACATAVRHGQVIKRALLGATASQTDSYHFDQYPVLLITFKIASAPIAFMPCAHDPLLSELMERIEADTRKGRHSKPKFHQWKQAS